MYPSVHFSVDSYIFVVNLDTFLSDTGTDTCHLGGTIMGTTFVHEVHTFNSYSST